MFVDNRQTRFARVLPAFLVILTAGGGTDGADDDDVRICGFDGVENLLEAVLEHVVDKILVADARYSRPNGSGWPMAARLAPHSVAVLPLQNSMRWSTSSM